MNEPTEDEGLSNSTSVQSRILEFVDNWMFSVVDIEILHQPEIIFQLKILAFLLAFLIINIVLIIIAWSAYGERISNMFMGQSKQ